MKKFGVSCLVLLLILLFCQLSLAEQKQIDFQFPATKGGRTKEATVTFDDSWFDAPSGTYNHKLTQLSISMAVSAFRDPFARVWNSDHYASEFLEKLGFSGYQAYDYQKEATERSISNAIAALTL